jgi:gamma-glutamylcyclotransferase (GGCT)/AIG2-like uncharacterized protein YtfP
MAADVSAFFVYGTLKKDQLRGKLWPRTPVSNVPALIQADLYDLGPYPAALRGDGWVLGELWQFRLEDMPITIEVLDRIEGFVSLGQNNEYDRAVMPAHYPVGSSVQCLSAFVYLRAKDARVDSARRIEPFVEFLSRKAAAWPDSKARVPKSFAEE